jgi:hypothetical protein
MFILKILISQFRVALKEKQASAQITAGKRVKINFELLVMNYGGFRSLIENLLDLKFETHHFYYERGSFAQPYSFRKSASGRSFQRPCGPTL